MMQPLSKVNYYLKNEAEEMVFEKRCQKTFPLCKVIPVCECAASFLSTRLLGLFPYLDATRRDAAN